MNNNDNIQIINENNLYTANDINQVESSIDPFYIVLPVRGAI